MILDQLPPGITSFYDQAASPRTVGPDAFKAACYLVAGMEGGSVEGLDFELLGRSYYAVTVRTRTEHASVLCNSIYPYLAFVPPGKLAVTDLEFLAPVSLASVFDSMTDFQSLNALGPAQHSGGRSPVGRNLNPRTLIVTPGPQPAVVRKFVSGKRSLAECPLWVESGH